MWRSIIIHAFLRYLFSLQWYTRLVHLHFLIALLEWSYGISSWKWISFCLVWRIVTIQPRIGLLCEWNDLPYFSLDMIISILISFFRRLLLTVFSVIFDPIYGKISMVCKQKVFPELIHYALNSSKQVNFSAFWILSSWITYTSCLRKQRIHGFRDAYSNYP